MTITFTAMPVKMTMSAGVILRRFMGATVTNALGIVNQAGPFGLKPMMERPMADTQNGNEARFSWAGPALFIAVALALVVFFWWLL